MKQLTTSEKNRLGKPIIDSKVLMWFRNRVYPLLMLLSKTKIKYKVKCLNTYNPIPNKSVIFAVNHSAFPDGPVASKATKRQSYILVGTQRLAPEDMLFFSLNGTIWVNRTDKKDAQNSKEALTLYLKNGCSILWFPEGTWNLTENLMMLPLKWGIISIALEAEAQIVPLALDYDRENFICTVKFGAPFLPPSDKKQGIAELRDRIATLRWELWEQRGIVHRNCLDIEACRKELIQSISDYSPLQWEKEQDVIFRPYEDPQEIFTFMNRLIPCRENAFLLRDSYKMRSWK